MPLVLKASDFVKEYDEEEESKDEDKGDALAEEGNKSVVGREGTSGTDDAVGAGDEENTIMNSAVHSTPPHAGAGEDLADVWEKEAVGATIDDDTVAGTNRAGRHGVGESDIGEEKHSSTTTTTTTAKTTTVVLAKRPLHIRRGKDFFVGRPVRGSYLLQDCFSLAFGWTTLTPPHNAGAPPHCQPHSAQQTLSSSRHSCSPTFFRISRSV